MIYTVVWIPAAQDELATIWLKAVDRNAVTVAAHTIDRLLRKSPESYGTVRYDTVRTLVVHPLGLDIEIADQDRIVYVLTVWDVTSGPTNGTAS